MTKIIAITNNKGGVGKTHTAFHLAGAFAEQGKEVLLIDLDPQSNLTGLFLTPEKITMSLFDVFFHEIPFIDAIYTTKFDCIAIVPSAERLETIEALLKDAPDSQVRLKNNIALLEHKYDYILLDCPPSKGLMTRNALAAAQRVVIPIEADKFSIDGLDKLLNLIQSMKDVANSELEIAGILVSLYKGRRSIEQLYTQLLSEKDLPIFDTKIKDSTKYREAITMLKPITHYRRRSPEAMAFRALSGEVSAVYAS